MQWPFDYLFVCQKLDIDFFQIMKGFPRLVPFRSFPAPTGSRLWHEKASGFFHSRVSNFTGGRRMTLEKI